VVFYSGHSSPSTIAVESAQSIDHFRANPDEKPADFIKPLLSNSGKTLLIVEEIPNDCAPCTNCILVRINGTDLKYDYATLPDRTTAQCRYAISEQPKVIKITDTTMTYRYSDGVTKTEKFKPIGRGGKRPLFPG